MSTDAPKTTERKRHSRWIGIVVLLLLLLAGAAFLTMRSRFFRIDSREIAPIGAAQTDISQLGLSISAFQRDRVVDYIPSRIVLREKMDYDMANPDEAESLRYLKQVWPHLQISGLPSGKSPNCGIDWNGNGEIEGDGKSSPAVILEGDQCLVFFLGGIPRNGEPTGFSRNPRNPASTESVSNPLFFEFPKSRLRDLHGNGFYSFIDPWGEQPYVYFSSICKRNGYRAKDCQSITGPDFAPYQTAPGSFAQPTGFQLISAGANKQFGNGGVWFPGSFAADSPDGDNLTNFHAGPLSRHE